LQDVVLMHEMQLTCQYSPRLTCTPTQ